jgi:hypothetical protein
MQIMDGLQHANCIVSLSLVKLSNISCVFTGNNLTVNPQFLHIFSANLFLTGTGGMPIISDKPAGFPTTGHT